MDAEQRKKHVKHVLIDRDLSFRAWCTQNGVPHSVARDLVYGRLTGNKSDRSRHVRDVLVKEFGDDIFD